MLKLITACVVLYIFSVVGTKAEYNVSNIEIDNPYMITIDGNLITLWVESKDGSVHMNSTNTYQKSYNINFGSNWNLRLLRNGIEAKVLAGGQRILIWGIAQELRYTKELTKEHGFETEYKLLLTNPASRMYEIVNLPPYEIPGDVQRPYGDIIVVTYADSFDVFLPGQRNCSPCRFDMKGNRVQLDYQLEFTSPKLAPYVTPKGVHIQLIDPADRKQGYFFARNFNNNTAVMEHLDEHFKTLKQLYVDYPVHSVSIVETKGHDRILSVCYASHNVYPVVTSDQFEVHCRQFDTNFQPKLSIRIPVNENNFVYGMTDLTHKIDALGITYVGLIESSNRRLRFQSSERIRDLKDDERNDKLESCQFHYFVYDKTGKLLESHDLNQDDRIINNRNRSNGLYSVLLNGDKICMNNHDFVSKTVYELKSYYTSRCFDITPYGS